MLEKIEKYQLLLSAALISISLLIAITFATIKLVKNDGITVTGSAYKIVTSDSGSLNFYINYKAPNKTEAYNQITKQYPIINDYLSNAGIKQEDIEYKAINGYYTYKQTVNGYNTNIPEYYNLTQGVQIKSNDVQKIKSVAKDIQSLITKGVDLNINEPQYYYSDLSLIKVELLEQATIDAKQRAKAMLKATGDRVGQIQSVKMGVFQITPVNSTNVSNMGISDTSTIEKKVTAVANVVFKVN